MNTTKKLTGVQKAGALMACSALLGSSSPAFANGWGGNLPVATHLPIGRMPVVPAAAGPGHAGNSGWAGHGQTGFSGGAPGSTGGSTGSAAAAVLNNALHGNTAGRIFNHFGHGVSPNGGTPNWHAQQNLSATKGTAMPALASLFSANTGSGPSGPGLQLDLTSSTPTIVLGSNIFHGKDSISLTLGGVKETFAPGAHVTAAEYVAVRQVLSGKGQTLTLNGQGSAVGGTFTINSVSSSPIGEMVIPSGVTALDYARGGNQVITGDLLNYGTIYGIGGRGLGISLTAQDIINGSGGVITTSLSRSLASAVGGVIAPVNLTLNASGDITNSGIIVSSGLLSLNTLNGSISNTLAGAGAAVPTITATHGINIWSGSGNLTNAGLIKSSNGNINIGAPGASNVNVWGAGGTIQAAKGDINVRDASYTGSSNINLYGGNYLSKNLNLNAGTGTIDGNVGNVTGRVNTNAYADHLQVAAPVLLLGNNKVVDPTFVNTAGSIQIVGTNSFDEDVAIIASGDITADSAGQIIDHGKNVTLVAGATITTTSGSFDKVQGNNGAPPYANSATAPVTIDTSSTANAGSILLADSKVSTIIDTSSTTGNAGNITLIANGDPAGVVQLANSSTINATATGSFNGGNVLIVAPAQSVNTILTGSIQTSGGAAGGKGGSIGLYTASATTTDSNPITFGTDGKVTSGNAFKAGSTITQSAYISVNGDLVTAPVGQSSVAAGTTGGSGGDITIVAGGSLSAKNILTFGGGGAGGDSAIRNGGAGGNGGNININAGQSNNGVITIVGQVNTSGGGGGGAGSDGASGGTGGAGGSAGTISITQTGPAATGQIGVNVSGGVLAATGGAGGNSSATAVGGGGASYGGGGGGGSSGTTGTDGKLGGGAGGAGFFGGGGADLDGAGGGGGYTGGAAGGSHGDATAGTASTGGNGVNPSATAPVGGQLASAQQGGQGIGALSDGANIPTSIGGNDITLTANARTSVGGDVVGKTISWTGLEDLKLNGNVFGTSSVSLSAVQSITQANSNLSIQTSNLSLDIQSAQPFYSFGSSAIPLTTNAQTIKATGTAQGLFITDSAASAKFDGSGLDTAGTMVITMSGQKASLDIAGLPTTVFSLTLNAGADPSTGGTINFEKSAINLSTSPTNFGLTLTANNLTWTSSGINALTINADNTLGGNGGLISLKINQTNGSNAIAIGNGAGALSLSALAKGSTQGTVGGTISLVAPNASLTVDTSALQFGYAAGTPSGKGGSLTFNVSSLTNAKVGALVLDASGTGTGNGGTISVTTNTASPQSIGTGAGDITLVAMNGGGAGVTQTGGSVSFVNQNTSGALTVDPAGIQLTNLTGINLNGGSITLTSGTITGPGKGQLALNVDGISGGGGSANGGKITITQTAASPSDVTLGSTGDFLLSAQGGTAGGNGGSVIFSTQGKLILTTDSIGNVIGKDLSVTVNPLGTGAGGTLTLSANSFENGSGFSTVPFIFDAAGVGTGAGGHLRINLLDPNANLTIGKGAGNMEFIATNGATGLVSGSAIITIANNATHSGTGTIFVDPTAIVLSAVTKANPNVSGGFVEVSGPLVAAAPSVPAKGPLILNMSGAGKANGGAIIFEESNRDASPIIGTGAGQFELLANAGKSGGAGGSITATSGGNLTVNPMGISVKAAGTGAGGALTLAAQNVGDGFNPLPNEGNLFVSGALSVNGAGKTAGGRISLSSNSTTTFNVGSSAKTNINGVKGGLSMSGLSGGGNLSIISGGAGGITIQSMISTPANITITAQNAKGDVNINSALGGSKTDALVINAPNTSIIGGNTGKLVTSTTGFLQMQANTEISGLTTTNSKGITTTKQLQINTLNLTANTITGDININDANTSKTTLNAKNVTSGNSIKLSSAGAISANTNPITAVNVANLHAAGGLFGNLIAAEGDIGTGGKTNARVNRAHISNGKDVNLTVTTNGSNAFNITFGENGKGNYSLQGDANLILSGTLGNSTSNIQVLNSAKAGSITGSALLSGKTVEIQTIDGAVGSFAQKLQVVSSGLTIDTNGAGNAYISSPTKATLYLKNSNAANFDIATVGGATLSNVVSTGGNIILNTGAGATVASRLTTVGSGNIVINTGSTATLTDLNSAGSISITTDGTTSLGNMTATGASGSGNIQTITAAGSLQTATNSKIYSQNGSISFTNNNLKSGSIVLGTGSDIETGIFPETGTGGDIIFSIGPAPTPAPAPQQQGTIPPINLVQGSTPGTGIIYWGSGVSATISKLGPNTVTAKNATVIFNTGPLKSTAIKLNGNVRVVADPPSLLGRSNENGELASGNLRLDVIKQSLAESLNPKHIESNIGSLASTASGSIATSRRAVFSSSYIQSNNLAKDTASVMNTVHRALPEDDTWISETESSDGTIPAILFSNLGFIATPRSSNVLELTEVEIPVAEEGSWQKSQNLSKIFHPGYPKLIEQFQEQKKTLRVQTGSILLANNSATTIETPFGSVIAPAKAIALLLITKTSMAIFDFHDELNRNISVSLEGQTIPMHPGQHIHITNTLNSPFESVNTASRFQYRRLRSHQVSKKFSLFQGDFYIPTALKLVTPFCQLMNSNNKHSKQLSDRLLKTAAILNSFGGDLSSYEAFSFRRRHQEIGPILSTAQRSF